MSNEKPLYPSVVGLDEEEESEEFDFKKYASAPNAKMAPGVPMAPPGGDDYDEKMNQKPAAINSSMTRQQKEMMKAAPPRLKDPPPGSMPENNNNGSFLHRPDRYQAKMAEYNNSKSNVNSSTNAKAKGMYHNTGTSTPGAQWNAPPVVVNNAGPIAQVQVVPPLQQAQEAPANGTKVGENNNDKDNMLKTRFLLLLMVAVALSIVCVVVVVVVVVRGREDETIVSPQSGSNNSGEEPTVTEKWVLGALESHPQTMDAIQNDPESPQAQAFGWITGGDTDYISMSISDTQQMKQRFALATFYYATSGDSWNQDGTTNSFLDYETHECSWLPTALSGEAPCSSSNEETINITEHYDIQHISLQNHGLEGSLPTEMSWLTGLESLDLFDNSVGGSIPTELGLLSNLMKIDLSGNSVTGTIPMQLGDLENLEELWLEQNDLSGNIPTSLNNTSLKYLRLRGNDGMRGRIPLDVCSLPGLTVDCGDPLALCGCPYCPC